MKTLLLATALAATLGAGGLAAAQPRGPAGPSITLYQGPNYQGPSRTFSATVDNLADQGFNDLAQSARVAGRWRVCEDARFRGRCVELSGDVPNLADLRMTGAISSMENLNGYAGGPGGGGFDRGPAPGGGFNGGPGGGYVDRGPMPMGPGGPGGAGQPGGDFAGQSLDGRSASFFPRPGAGPYRNADEFCRRLGFSGAIYADDRGRNLRDVLCRR